MNQYAYNGPVMEFGRCIADNWAGSTYAASKITLPGELMVIN